ncbi:MAG: YecA family protein [Caulobacteraceae bacterium]|nr:YecA family protein [Caulobacteraceae bacterium]
MTDAPFTYDELDALFRGDGRNDDIGLSAIDGMIAALVAGPTVVPQEEWLPLIFADHMPRTPSERWAAATIMSRYAEVEAALTQQPPAYRPIFMSHLGQSIVQPWALGFMLGVGVRRDAWTPMLLGPKRRELLPILVSSELGRMLLPDIGAAEVEQIAADAPLKIADVVRGAWTFHERKRRPSKLAQLRKPSRRHA